MFNQLFDYELFQDRAIVFQCVCIMAEIPAAIYIDKMNKDRTDLAKLFAIDNDGKIHRFNPVVQQLLNRKDHSEDNVEGGADGNRNVK